MMNGWNAMTFEGRDNMLRVVRQEADRFFEMASSPEAWERQTACADWQVRDLVGHLVDTTESYFVAFEAARNKGEVDPAYGLPGMAARAGSQATALRTIPQANLVDRARTDFAKMYDILQGLGPEEWTGLTVSHFYMGPLPAFFYPAFQLMDYGVHSWDIREGAGLTHALSGEVADLLVPFMFVIWQATALTGPDTESAEIGIRILGGANAGDTRIQVSPNGLTYEPGEVKDLPTVIEFDPASFVLTVFGRYNAGTVRGDTAAAQRFLNLFFRI
ncbi:MAG: hypothetical protein QOF35_30 [Actinomycetota bacterium]|nr:hypothetical protein [Actinomycetota bacterium]